MFDLPDAKRVKRSKIFSSFSSSEDEVDEAVSESASKSKVADQGPSFVSKLKSDHDGTSKSGLEDHGQNIYGHNTQVDYGFEYEFVDKTQPLASNHINAAAITAQTSSQEEPAEQESQTYAFNLFAPKPKSKLQAQPTPDSPTLKSNNGTTSPPPPLQPTTTHITIRSPTPTSPTDPLNQGRLLKPRPQSHYFTSSLPPQTLQTLKSQYLESAISVPSIQQLSTRSWPGTSLPWRIIAIPAYKLVLKDSSLTNTDTNGNPLKPSSSSSSSSSTTNKPSRARTRPSKKRRIQQRQRLAARETAKQAAATASKPMTDEEEREKRTRRNREKKVKKKMRDKAKKTAAAATATATNNGDGGKNEGMDVNGAEEGTSNSED